ncbi:MAG TPA: aspartate dehydrogenase domain-containing protein [Hyphomicrobiaceae bacterium]|nr:aspartate dehydrogenase domain-containing protein [Hyphomicrobiaceae bacterium]
MLMQRRAQDDDAETAVGIATRSPGARATFPAAARPLADPADLAGMQPDLVVEAAGRAAVAQWAPAALAAAPELIVTSTSAFCDDALMARLVAEAERCGSRIHVPSGAIGGIDALASASVLGIDEVVHQVVKPPQAWRNTAAEQHLALDALQMRTVFFSGTAREAAAAYPQNANATVVTSLAAGEQLRAVVLVGRSSAPAPEIGDEGDDTLLQARGQRGEHIGMNCGAFQGELRLVV